MNSIAARLAAIAAITMLAASAAAAQSPAKKQGAPASFTVISPYTIQWAERAAGSSTPGIDEAKWQERLRALMPIRLRPIVSAKPRLIRAA